MSTRRYYRKAARGTTLVEFAFTTVLTVLMLLSAVEMGRMVLVYTTIAGAARAGTRYWTTHGSNRVGTAGTYDGPNDCSPANNAAEVKTIVNNFASMGLFDTSAMTITAACFDSTGKAAQSVWAGDSVRLTLTYTYDPLISYFKLGGLTIRTESDGVIAY